MVNKADFELLFKQYYPVLCSIARGYVRDRMVIEEIVDDVFVKFWNYRSHIVIHGSVKDYLFKSTRNACVDYLRANQKYQRQTEFIDEQQIVCDTLADLGEDPLDYMITNETGQRIMQAIDELPERYRLTFRLCRIDELSYDEVAEIMSISKNTVKSNLRDAMAILRKKLSDLAILLLFFFL
jgi:RNA polymerase sigma-70 factor (ECF subfamily)